MFTSATSRQLIPKPDSVSHFGGTSVSPKWTGLISTTGDGACITHTSPAFGKSEWSHLKASLKHPDGQDCCVRGLMFLCSVCVRVQCSLGSIVEPQSARAPSLRAGDAPNQQLLSGVADSAQPALLWPVCQLLQRAAEDWASRAARTFHVSKSYSLSQQSNIIFGSRGKIILS